MEVILLAGGFGTRLKGVISDIPKPMAPINKKPFLEYILEYLTRNNVKSVIMAVGYKKEVIMNYFGESFKDISLLYSIEEEPLGTGGAIKKAMSLCSSNSVFVINGDTMFDVNLKRMYEDYIKYPCEISIAVKEMFDVNRYGTISIKNNKIISFTEKTDMKKGIINGGIYLINKNIFDDYKDDAFSFEKTVLESLNHNMRPFVSEGYFIDIGVPNDYYKAKKDFGNEE